MKRFLFFLLLAPLFVLAQKPTYKIHKVAPKESFTSIGRLYNVNGRELANFNNLEYEKGLSIGQEIKIPVTNSVTPPTVVAPVAKPVEVPVVKSPNVSSGSPVYHIVTSKQTLYGVSKLYNVTIPDIKKWNNLTADGLNEGMKLIVGYGGAAQKPEQVVAVNPVVSEPIKPVVKAPVQEPAPVAVAKPVVKTEPIKNVPSNRNMDGGYFKPFFKVQVSGSEITVQNGNAGVFKSNSGWEDGKYYCLHNGALPGSIAKIVNTDNGKVVYAKVLDVIPDIKQNAGLVLRLSNAAADELGVSGAKFYCEISYVK
jgi:LysM repeat protein